VHPAYTLQPSALGVADLAGMGVGVWDAIDDVRHAWRSGGVFTPRLSADERDARFAGWQQTITAAQLGSRP
jgi:glycerol kinase